ncbi:MAG TPA: 2-succinyl-5-enolpyruvyl-6-hydroxy-3-cyclohexene-1-carboxylic-acid synthase [Solirubrobacteraceae bacterium]|nr:2-succinyl-5-enolpyruvyl-6-hydroxy-3-cyclohexene-1-carboxylic-acid synthase [Solirubrobacteraceae bacterium]
MNDLQPQAARGQGRERAPTDGGSHALLRALCDELARCGMRHACTSPGSRNTPLVLALAREERIRCWSQIDERCAAFFALGIARVTGEPVAVTCTSGTAAANLAPAVIEAHQARVPLLVLTADRPPELREVGAGQAIDQLKLFGGATRWFFEVGVEGADAGTVAWIRQLACRAYWTAAGERPGPVHLNFPLREPLVADREPAPERPEPWQGRPGGRPWVVVRRPAARSAPPPREPLPARGVIVAGRHERDGRLGPAAARFAQRAGWPLLADPLSGARRGRAAIATYDLLLRSRPLTGALRPDVVLRVGDLPTSKSLRSWLGCLRGVRQIALDPEGAWQDPDAAVWEIEAADPAATLDAWRTDAPDPGWLSAWLAADAAAAGAIDRELGARALSEPLVARLLGDELGADATLVVASSMPIRDVESYMRAGEGLPRVLSNRGANGIDGTVSTAFGVAAASRGPVALLIGDVALAHDIGGLLAARRLGLSLTIVALNNDGGGIFHFLQIAGQSDVFEQHVATAHGLAFEHAAALYGLEHRTVCTAGQLRAALRERASHARLIEVRSDRRENLLVHQRLAEAAVAAASAAVTARQAAGDQGSSAASIAASLTSVSASSSAGSESRTIPHPA